MRAIALRISPGDAEVPSSTQSADEMHGADFSTKSASSISRGTKPDAHRIGSRAPLGLDPRAAELQICVHMVCISEVLPSAAPMDVPGCWKFNNYNETIWPSGEACYQQNENNIELPGFAIRL
jgi:hypothetical protein